MRIICFEVNLVAPDTDATIVMLRGVVDQALGDGASVMPDGAAGARVESESVVRGGHEHDAVDDNGRDVEIISGAHVKNPLRAETGNIFRSDFGKSAEASPGVVAIVRNPVCGGRRDEQSFGSHVDGCGDGHPSFFLNVFILAGGQSKRKSDSNEQARGALQRKHVARCLPRGASFEKNALLRLAALPGS